MGDQAKSSGRFQKGQPSPNPAGRAAPFAAAEVAKAKAKAAAGSDGVIAYGGYVSSGESSSKLSGKQKWIEYANAPIRSAPTAIAYLLRHALLAGAKWSLVENEKGGKAARKGVDIVQRGMLDAKLPTPWRSVVSKALNGRYFSGFSIHATALGRRPDGLVAFTDIGDRPQHTIERWLRASSTDPFTDVVQRIDSGETFTISLDECLYLRNDMLGSGPDGPGVLRLIVERQRQTFNYRGLEGSELFSGMGGTPIARVPLEDINHGVPSGSTEAEALAYKRTKIANIESIVSERIKTPERRQYAVLDSATYQGSDPNTISGVKKWDIEIVKAELAGLQEIRKVITDNDLDDARVLGVEFVFLGQGALGSGMEHESKVSLFGAQLSGDLDVMGLHATMLARRLILANGLDPDEATPTVMASPISTEDVEKTCRALGLLNMAGLRPNHPAKIALFERLNLPWEDEPEAELMAPRVPVAPAAVPPKPGDEIATVDPAKPEDVKPADPEVAKP